MLLRLLSSYYLYTFSVVMYTTCHLVLSHLYDHHSVVPELGKGKAGKSGGNWW